MKSITPDALAAKIASGTAPAVLDVRSKAEFDAGHVPGAVNVPFSKVRDQSVALPGAAEDPIVVYCGHGPRAWIAGAALRKRGYTQVTYLKGHWAAWKREIAEVTESTDRTRRNEDTEL